MLNIAFKNVAVSYTRPLTFQKNSVADLKNLIIETSTLFFEMDLPQIQQKIPYVFNQILQLINANEATLDFFQLPCHNNTLASQTTITASPPPPPLLEGKNKKFNLFFEQNPHIAQFLKQHYPTLYIPDTQHLTPTIAHPYLQIFAEYCQLHNIKSIFVITATLPLSKTITSICTYFSDMNNQIDINEKITELLQKWATFVNYALDYQNVKIEEQQRQEINFLINQVASDFIAVEYNHIPNCILQLLNNFACYLSANSFLIFKIDELADKLAIPYAWSDNSQTENTLRTLSYNFLSQIYPCLQQKKIVFLETQQQIRQKLPNLHLHAQYANTQAAIFIPIILENNLKEIIALFTDDPNHTWTKNLTETLYGIIPLFTQIAEREHQEKQNLELLELSNIIDNIAVQFIPPTNLKSKISSAISKVANYLGAGVAQVFLFNNNQQVLQAIAFESYNNLNVKANSQAAAPTLLPTLTYTEHHAFLQRIINGNFVYNNTNNISNLPSHLTSLTNYFVAHKVKNYLAVPIILKNDLQQETEKTKIIGFMHFMAQNPMIKITPKIQNKLEMLGTMIAATFDTRKQYEFE